MKAKNPNSQPPFTEAEIKYDLLELMRAGKVIAVRDPQGHIRYLLAQYKAILEKPGMRMATMEEVIADLFSLGLDIDLDMTAN